MSQTRKRYSREDRLSILRDYYFSGLSLRSYAKQHDMKDGGMLAKWIKMYEEDKDFISLQAELAESEMGNRNKDSYKEENALLKKRIKELEKALAFSRLETEARDILIDKAEEYFNVPIRKKSGAKQ